jgi:hypothetical protein
MQGILLKIHAVLGDEWPDIFGLLPCYKIKILSRTGGKILGNVLRKHRVYGRATGGAWANLSRPADGAGAGAGP